MIKFNTPESLNGSQLRKELAAAGVPITSGHDSIELDGNGDLWLDIKETDKTKAKAVVDAHVAINNPKILTVAEKLEMVGLSLDELKAAISA
jgi:hypothetical protein